MLSWRRTILWRRALDWLKTYQPLVIAVTGTYGKSTAAAAIERVLKTNYTVRWMPEAGLDPAAIPLAILGLADDPATTSWYRGLTTSFAREIASEEPQALILEIPAHRPGDVDWIARRLRPDITVVTNVGTANLELFVSKENIAHELASLAVATKGTLITNHDDALLRGLPSLSHAAALSYGTGPEADVKLTRANRLPVRQAGQREAGFALEIKTHREMAELLVPQVIARHQLLSLVAALAVGHALKIPLAASAKALYGFAPPRGRTSLAHGQRGSRIIDDSANATPESMQQALETLRALPSRRRIAVLGDIARLGREAEHIHRHLGRQAAQTANIVIAVGESMRWAGTTALQAGADVHHFDRPEDAGAWLEPALTPDDTVLISGGREMHMGRLVERLVNSAESV